MQWVSIVGNSRSGTSTLARRIAAAVDVSHHELDGSCSSRDHLRFVHLTSHADAERWLAQIS
jgi:adenylate kinase family enzyme